MQRASDAIFVRINQRACLCESVPFPLSFEARSRRNVQGVWSLTAEGRLSQAEQKSPVALCPDSRRLNWLNYPSAREADSVDVYKERWLPDYRPVWLDCYFNYDSIKVSYFLESPGKRGETCFDRRTWSQDVRCSSRYCAARSQSSLTVLLGNSVARAVFLIIRKPIFLYRRLQSPAYRFSRAYSLR